MLSRHPPNFLPLAWLPTYPCRYQFLEEQLHTETDGPGTPFFRFEAEHAWRRHGRRPLRLNCCGSLYSDGAHTPLGSGNA